MTIFDIETIALPQDQLEAMLPPFDENEVKFGNTKDPLKRQAIIDEKRASYLQDFIDGAALSAITATVAVIGFHHGDAGVQIVEGDEREMITNFWELCRKCAVGTGGPIVGFNIEGFDVPFLIRRSWIIGVPVPLCAWKGRYMGDVFVDLMKRWTFGNNQQYISLDAVARALGVGQKNGSGADFGKLWATDKPKALEYAKHDIILTHGVAVKMGV